MIIRRTAALAAILLLLLATALTAQEPTPSELLDRWDRDATRAEEVLTTAEASTSALEVLRETLVGQRAAARIMVADETKQLEPLLQQLAALGPVPEDGSPETIGVTAARTDLDDRIKPGEGRRKKAELALTRVDGLIKRLDSLIRTRFTDTLLSVGPSPLSPWRWPGAVAEYMHAGERLAREARRGFADPLSRRNRETRLPGLAIGTILAFLLVYWARRWLIGALRRVVKVEAGRGRQLAVGVVIATTRLFGPLIVLGLGILAVRQSGVVGATASLLGQPLVGGLVAVIAAYALGQVMFAPGTPELRNAELDDTVARRGARLTLWLGVAVFLELLFVDGGAKIGLAASALAVANLLVVLLGGVTLYRLSNIIRPKRPAVVELQEDEESSPEQLNLWFHVLNAFTLFMKAAAILAPILAALGYFAASRYTLYPVILTVGLFASAIIVFITVSEAIDAYVEERDSEAQGLRLLPILIAFLLFCAALPVLALIWGARSADLNEWWRYFADGFQLGEVTISPLDFLKFVVVFTIGYSLTRLVQSVLRMSVLPNTRLDGGVRAAITSGTGYVGYTVAAVAAIAATGLDLSNVAIVAGALSVGIGFGLQNVVNNFVSGIMLLIERPIKVGDWIEVGTAQGYVSKISVRATEIETFDRATLIVPNSELIANTVLNMTHSDMIGRVRVPVGVAYGTDTRKVEKILMEIARAHPLTLRNPAPNVLFIEFGSDSLDFEIRTFLRDVNYVLSARSDMNHEINRRFAEEGIEIPFAQRDLHIKNVDELGKAIGDAAAGGTQES